ncbi:MAG: Stealth CR1 domain-containing protein [Akkermansia sp.]|nr:Stealth CR1 domain-containing protein [Akkermansia sp.]
MKDYDIDLVYLWCDGNDENFARQRRERMRQCNAAMKENPDCRYVQIDELKYSLRSVVMHMPWIHHIYIVTNNQIPKWFRPHEKITIVDHSEILPESARPCFNSQALECCLHKIPNLAEHFIYANDDMFVGRKITPNFFYERMGKPIVRWKKSIIGGGLYWHTIKTAHEAIKQRFGITFGNYSSHHNMDAYTKTILAGCEKEFPDWFHHTIHQPFRNESCLQRILFLMYALVKKQAVLKDVSRTFLQRVMKKIHMAYLDSMVESNHSPMKHLAPNHPALFCINDCEVATDEDRARTRCFLESRFPVKSPFER